ncbi:unnamed protein product [Allacma fusca]|uniref:Chitin-binding type-2 domain-containing protein n=1 Tax=Allacma fusca TaxID=39272 RepID=A0A8J2LGP8_9HEXA|nr:unnamed protein product [Allacma fusca]
MILQKYFRFLFRKTKDVKCKILFLVLGLLVLEVIQSAHADCSNKNTAICKKYGYMAGFDKNTAEYCRYYFICTEIHKNVFTSFMYDCTIVNNNPLVFQWETNTCTPEPYNLFKLKLTLKLDYVTFFI